MFRGEIEFEEQTSIGLQSDRLIVVGFGWLKVSAGLDDYETNIRFTHYTEQMF